MKTFLRRTFSTVILLFLFFASIFWKGNGGFTIFSLLVILLSYFAVREFTTILKQSGNPADTVLTPLFTSLTAIFALFNLYDYALIAAAILMIHNWLRILTSGNQEKTLRSVLNSSAAYFLFTIPIVMLVWLYCQSPVIFLFLVIVTKISDIGAYVTGTVCNALSKGRNHKMVPSISPGKSYEGAAGGILSAIAASFVIWPYCGFVINWYFPLLTGIVLFFGSVAGDLAESVFKRICKVKDSGNFLPGIGGIFDLVDSLLINSALFFLFLYLLRSSIMTA